MDKKIKFNWLSIVFLCLIGIFSLTGFAGILISIWVDILFGIKIFFSGIIFLVPLALIFDKFFIEESFSELEIDSD